MYRFLTIILAALLWCHNAGAVDVGDIYYSDRTFSTNLNSSKMPIAVVYWVNTDKTKAYVLALRQPENMTLSVAKTQCANFSTLGTNSGDWDLPTMKQAFNMITQRWNGVSDNKFSVVNSKLGKIETGQALKNDYYWTLGYQNKWKVNPSTGDMSYDGSTSGSRAVRCVMEVPTS